jgi:hypothetical protein
LRIANVDDYTPEEIATEIFQGITPEIARRIIASPGNMPRILLDTNMPIGIRTALHGHAVVTAFEAGWNALENGDLLAAAETDGYDVLITGDKNLSFQQNLTERSLALGVQDTNHWPTIQANLDAVIRAVNNASQGGIRAFRLLVHSFVGAVTIRRTVNNFRWFD